MNIKKVALEFGIECNSYSQPSNAALAQVYILDKKFVLRGRPFYDNTLVRYQEELVLLEKVRKLIPFLLPRPMVSKKGDKWVIAEGVLWTMYSIIKGDIICSWQDTYDASERQTRELLSVLRKIHDCTKDKFKSNLKNVFINEVKSISFDLKPNLSGKIIKRINDAIRQIMSSKSNTSCFIHGDFHYGNTIVKDNAIVGLVDFDWCRIGNPLEDLAYTIMMLMRDYRYKFRFDEAYMNKLLKWYGLDPKLRRLFLEYLILYVFYDVYIFKHASMKNQKKYYIYQCTFLKYVCDKY